MKSLKNYTFVTLGLLMGASLQADVKTYVNLREKPITLSIKLSNGATKKLNIDGDSTAQLDIGNSLINSITVSGPDRRNNYIPRSFTFNENYKPKYKEVLNRSINYIDDDENITRSRPFRFMEEDDAKTRAYIAQKLTQFSTSAKAALRKAAVAAGEGAVWVGNALKEIGQTAAGYQAVTK